MGRPAVFISHAAEDKALVARPLAQTLTDRGFQVWYDEFSLTVGDRLLSSIDAGLRTCDFGVVILSQHFFSKQWPQMELAGLAAREVQAGKKILPVWHEVTFEDVVQYSPMLADRLAASTSSGLYSVVERLLAGMRAAAPSPDHYLIPFTITGPRLLDAIRTALASEVSSIQMQLYCDASGVDEDRSYVDHPTGARRRIRDDDVLEVLNRLSVVPHTHNVVHWAVHPEMPLWVDKYDNEEEIPIDLQDVPDVVFVAALEPMFVPDGELVRYIRSLVRLNDGLPYTTHGDFWQGRSSIGRALVRRLLARGGSEELLEDLEVDSGLQQEHPSDYRKFCLARAVVLEGDKDYFAAHSGILESLLNEYSPLSDFWKARARARARGDPLWVDDPFTRLAGPALNHPSAAG